MVAGEPVTREGLHVRKDGSTFPVEVRLAMFDSRDGPLFLALARDVTDRKRLEQQLLQSQKMEAVGRLAGGVAHEFNNVLTAIIGYAHLGEEQLGTGFREILDAAGNATRLTRQLLAVSRQHVTEPKVLNLNDLILSTDGMLRRVVGEDIELVTLPGSEPGFMKADPGQINQVLINLAVNSRDSMPDGGKLTIRSSNVTVGSRETRLHPGVRPGEYVLLVVSDTGLGMTDEVKARAFEPFFTTKPEGAGTGLGMSTCYAIVEQSGGHITLDSEPGRGTAVRIYLPLVTDTMDDPSAGDSPAELPIGTETVLLVEDEPVVRDVASQALRERGYTVLEATNGSEALGLAVAHEGEQIHLLLTDVVMPLTGGRELAQQVRASRPETRVLFTSGYADPFVLETGTAFIQKPFTPKSLARKVREVLDA